MSHTGADMSDNVSILPTPGEFGRNPGMAFELDWLEDVRINTSAVERRAANIPPQHQPLAVTDFYQVLDTSDLPGGVLNIVSGERDELAQVLAEHNDVDALWYFGPAAGGAAVEHASASNLKRIWSNHGRQYNWYSAAQMEGREVLYHAVNVKNIWAPYGE